jgi:uncharacterized lipoprotein YehR (DUF1307 family)
MKAKCVVVLVALVIALGAVMMITGCNEENKTPTKAHSTTTVEKNTKTTVNKTTK